MSEAGRKEELSLLSKLDNKNIMITDLILEILRLRQLLAQHGIDWKRSG